MSKSIRDGIHKDISNAAYHANDRLSTSGIKKIRESIADFELYKEKPTIQTTPLRLGSLFDMYLFDGEFDDSVFLIPPEIPLNKDGSPKKSAKAYKELAGEIGDKTILTAQELATFQKMKSAIYSHKRAAAIMAEGESQTSILFTDPETGIKCQVRPDWITSNNFLVDLKTCPKGKASPRNVGRHCHDFGYQIQDSFYTFGHDLIADAPANGFLFLFVEKEEPFHVSVIELDEDAKSLGAAQFRQALDKYGLFQNSVEEQKEELRGYGHDIKTISLPGYAFF